MQPITISGYSYNSAPQSSYIDSGGELTDGFTDYVVWPGPITDVTPLVGWQTVNGSVTFSFDSISGVESVAMWFADSDGSAGVVIPLNVELFDMSDGATSLGTFALTNPAGSGTTVPLTINGLGVTTDRIRLDLLNNNSSQWNVLTEVEFTTAAVPERTTYGLVLGTLTLFGGAVLRRRRA